MSSQMYYCSLCDKVFRLNGPGKQVKCPHCTNILLDMGIVGEEYAELDKQKRDELKKKTKGALNIKEALTSDKEPAENTVQKTQVSIDSFNKLEKTSLSDPVPGIDLDTDKHVNISQESENRSDLAGNAIPASDSVSTLNPSTRRFSFFDSDEIKKDPDTPPITTNANSKKTIIKEQKRNENKPAKSALKVLLCVAAVLTLTIGGLAIYTFVINLSVDKSVQNETVEAEENMQKDDDETEVKNDETEVKNDETVDDGKKEPASAELSEEELRQLYSEKFNDYSLNWKYVNEITTYTINNNIFTSDSITDLSDPEKNYNKLNMEGRKDIYLEFWNEGTGVYVDCYYKTWDGHYHYEDDDEDDDEKVDGNYTFEFVEYAGEESIDNELFDKIKVTRESDGEQFYMYVVKDTIEPYMLESIGADTSIIYKKAEAMPSYNKANYKECSKEQGEFAAYQMMRVLQNGMKIKGDLDSEKTMDNVQIDDYDPIDSVDAREYVISVYSSDGDYIFIHNPMTYFYVVNSIKSGKNTFSLTYVEGIIDDGEECKLITDAEIVK